MKPESLVMRHRHQGKVLQLIPIGLQVEITKPQRICLPISSPCSDANVVWGGHHFGAVADSSWSSYPVLILARQWQGMELSSQLKWQVGFGQEDQKMTQ